MVVTVSSRRACGGWGVLTVAVGVHGPRAIRNGGGSRLGAEGT